MTGSKAPTLTDAKSMGGIVAQDGFDYQVWDALARLPAWLRNPGFEGFAVETLEDVEARFFAPHAPRGHVLDRFQAKSGVLDRAGLIEVFESFRAFQVAHSKVARVQTLVTPALPPRLAWLARDAGRVRRARPFYDPFADVRAASDDKLRSDLVEELGQPLGNFFADEVEVAPWSVQDRATAEAAFSAALQQQFPELDLPTRKVTAAFSTMIDLVARTRGTMLTRSALLSTLRDVLGADLVPDRDRLPLHVRSDRNGEVADAIEVDASGLSGSPSGFPEPERWAAELVHPLVLTAAWARKHGIERIALSGSYRLSTAFALGWAFRSAIGFEVDIPIKGGTWATDEHPAAGHAPPPWTVEQPSGLVGERMAIGIGVLRDPGPDVLKGLGPAGEGRLLLATLPQALVSSMNVQASVQFLKGTVERARARLRPVAIDLYYVGPAAFAVALGHRWNALPPTQLYEFLTAEGRYTPTVMLG